MCARASKPPARSRSAARRRRAPSASARMSTSGSASRMRRTCISTDRSRMTRVAAFRAHAVNVTPRTNWVFVELATDDGIVGIGEASLNGWEPLLLAHAATLADVLSGADFAVVAALTRY